MGTISVKVSDEIAKLCEGYEVEYKFPQPGELVATESGRVQAIYKNTSAYLVLTPKFDLATWWPEWLKCDWVRYDLDTWWAESDGGVCVANLSLLGVDCSQLDKNQVYRNPHKEVGT